MPTLGPNVCRQGLLWAIGSPMDRADIGAVDFNVTSRFPFSSLAVRMRMRIRMHAYTHRQRPTRAQVLFLNSASPCAHTSP